MRPGVRLQLWRWLLLVLLAVLALQLYFLGRIALMGLLEPQSTSFQRSEAWRLISTQQRLPWRHEIQPYERISLQLKRAVIASEDAGFVEHSGVEWEALEKAWDRNQKAEARAQRQTEQLGQRLARQGDEAAASKAPPVVVAKVVGGSTITQQLAKNLFLSGERRMLRKAQEFVLTFMLEGLLSKRRILEIYLNQVEWGEGVFGAEAAAQHYFRTSAAQLSAGQAARLAVMLPAPKRFEKRPGSAYVSGRAGTVMARMGGVVPP